MKEKKDMNDKMKDLQEKQQKSRLKSLRKPRGFLRS